MTGAEALASLLLERLDLQGKPDLAAITRRLGLRVKEVDALGFDGVLVRAKDGQKGVIGVKRSIREWTRKRFTIAHEIGHYLIPSHRKLMGACAGEDIERWHGEVERAEREANHFAAELVLPARLVHGPLDLGNPSLHTISAVASQFEASLTATVYRFLELTDLACAMVWSEGGRARWSQRSSSFPFPLVLGELPDPRSFAGHLFAGKSARQDLEPIHAECWLDRRDAQRCQQLLEHSVSLPAYNAVLTFLWLRQVDREQRGCRDDEDLLEELDPDQFTLRRRRWPR